MKPSKSISKIDPKSLHENRKLCKTVKPIFSGTMKTSSSVTFLENNEIIYDDKSVAEIFNDHSNIIKNSQSIEGTGQTHYQPIISMILFNLLLLHTVRIQGLRA